MHPLLLKIGALSFYSYGLMVSLGFLAGIIVAYFLAKKIGVDAEKIIDVGLFVLVGAMLGARIFYVIFYWHELKSPWEAFMVWNGGLVFYGGLVFAVLAVVLACKIFKLSLLDVLDVATPATALGYAFGRIGCFLNGCCYGIECALPWAVHFPNLPGLRHPTQIYASLAGLAMFGILLFLFYRRGFQGQVFAAGVFLYSIYRFFIEFIRVNPKSLFGLSDAQLASILLFAGSIVLYGLFYRRSRSK